MIEYTKLSDALAALESRRHLRPRVEEYLRERGVGLPWDETLGDGKPLAVLFRQVATPNYENVRFCGIAEGLGLQPLFFEYHDDEFSTENDYKLSLARVPVMRRIAKNGTINFRRIWICDEETKSHVLLRELKTKAGGGLIDFHHKLLENNPNTKDTPMVDISPWVHAASAKRAKDYYPIIFSLFASHGILFENFLSKGSEKDFVETTASNAAKFVSDKFGVSPLIVPLNPTDIEDSEFWFCQYPDVISSCRDEQTKPNEN